MFEKTCRKHGSFKDVYWSSAIATNGIKLAKSLEFCKELAAAGLHSVYLQFDGVTGEPYLINRGFNYLPIKLKAIENCRASGLTSVSLRSEEHTSELQSR